MEKLTEQEIIRRQKMEELKAMGIDPFGHAYRERTNQDKFEKSLENLQKKN